MREPLEPVEPGKQVESSVTWRSDDEILPGAGVEATDGFMGTVRERRLDQGPERAYLGIQTDEGILYLPERLVRERRGDTIMLSLPRADARAQGSLHRLPVESPADHLPTARRP